MTTSDLVPTAVLDRTRKGPEFLDQARACAITDQASYDLAVELRRAGEDLDRSIEADFAPVKAKAWEAHKAICALEHEKRDPVKRGIEWLKRAQILWETEQECIRKQEQARLTELARQQQEEMRLQAACEAEAAGAIHEEVEAILEQPVTPVVITAPATYEPARGYAHRTRYRAEVTDLRALCAAVASGSVPTAAIEANMTVLNKQADSLREAWNWPGCRAVAVTSSVRTGR